MHGCFLFLSQKFGFEAQLDPIEEAEENQDQSKDILNSILNEDVLSGSDSEEPIEESWTNKGL